jgi:hypothetical protein
MTTSQVKDAATPLISDPAKEVADHQATSPTLRRVGYGNRH